MDQPTSPTRLIPIGTATARVPDSCDSCRAPLGQDQRYCVRCGARRRDVNDPVARYLADASRRTRTVAPEPTAAALAPTPHRASPLVLPILLALVPVAAAIGVMAGRSGHNGDTAQVLAALRKQKPVVVSVGRSGGGGAVDTAGGGGAGGSTKKAKGAAAKGAGNGKVLTKTKYGAATAVTNYHPSKATVKRDAQVVNRVNHTVGKTYVDSQKNLPDQIAIP